MNTQVGAERLAQRREHQAPLGTAVGTDVPRVSAVTSQLENEDSKVDPRAGPKKMRIGLGASHPKQPVDKMVGSFRGRSASRP